jgi:hypothetical protein
VAVISIKTEGDKYLTTKIFYYTNGREDEKEFDSGDLVKDWFHATRHFLATVQNQDDDESNKVISTSYYVGEWIFNQNPVKYKTAFIHLDLDNIFSLKYVSESYPLYLAMRAKHWEVFVPADSNWNWDQYKTYCNETAKPKSNKTKKGDK